MKSHFCSGRISASLTRPEQPMVKNQLLKFEYMYMYRGPASLAPGCMYGEGMAPTDGDPVVEKKE